MNKRLMVLIAASVFATASVAADSMDSSTKYDKQFNKLDKNHDGKISKDEAKANKTLKKDWSAADADSDGTITKSEFSAFEVGRHTKKSSMSHSSSAPSDKPAKAGSD